MSYPVFASNVPTAEGKCPTFADSRSAFAPMVSVIIPVRNRSEVIVRCLQSVAAQTYERVRLIVVDNGSTDDTRSRVADWMSVNAGRFVETCLLDEPCSGANAARNRGLRVVTDGYVAFFDSDDEMSPDFLTQMLATLRKDAAAQWVLARTRMIFPDGTEQVRHGVPHPSAAHHLLSAQVSTQSFVAEANLLRTVGGWDETLTCWQDYELGFRLLRAAPRPAWCSSVFHRIYRTPHSITGASLSENAEGIVHVLRKLAEQVEKVPNFPPHTLDIQLNGGHFATPSADFSPIAAGGFPKSAESSVQAVDASPAVADSTSIAEHATAEQAQCRLALWLRVHIVAGQFRAEGATSSADALLSTVGAPLCRVSWLDRVVARLLMAYTSRGGRGAWRFAALWTRLR